MLAIFRELVIFSAYIPYVSTYTVGLLHMIEIIIIIIIITKIKFYYSKYRHCVSNTVKIEYKIILISC